MVLCHEKSLQIPWNCIVVYQYVVHCSIFKLWWIRYTSLHIIQTPWWHTVIGNIQTETTKFNFLSWIGMYQQTQKDGQWGFLLDACLTVIVSLLWPFWHAYIFYIPILHLITFMYVWSSKLVPSSSLKRAYNLRHQRINRYILEYDPLKA